jgi:hypothetical protein
MSRVAERRSKIRERSENPDERGRSDIFSLLVKANEMEEKERLRLSDDELVSSFFHYQFYVFKYIAPETDRQCLYFANRWAWNHIGGSCSYPWFARNP